MRADDVTVGDRLTAMRALLLLVHCRTHLHVACRQWLAVDTGVACV